MNSPGVSLIAAAVQLRRGNAVRVRNVYGELVRLQPCTGADVQPNMTVLAQVAKRMRLAEVQAVRISASDRKRSVELKELGWIAVENIFGKVIP
jgi:hypothetical protein